MSGPKYSTAVINTALLQKMIDELEKQIEENTCSSLIKQIHANERKIKRIQESVTNSEIETLIEKCENLIPGNPVLLHLKEIIKSICSVTYGDITGKNSGELSDLLSETVKNVQMLESLKSQVQDVIKQLKEEYNVADTDKKESEYKSKSFEKIDTNFSLITPRLKKLYDELIILVSSLPECEEIKKGIDDIMNNERTDEAYKFKQLKMRLDTIELSTKPNTSPEEHRLDSLISYLQSILGIEEETPSTLIEKQVYSEQLKSRVKAKKVDKFISDTVSEVMTECGYDLVQSDVLHSSKKIVKKNIFDYSDESVLQVATSDDGAVMFEIMGRKTNDTMTPDDRSSVAIDMEHFCPDYKRIKSALSAKGIELTDEKLFPPSVKYVRGSSVGDSSRKINTSNRRAKSGKKVNKHVDD